MRTQNNSEKGTSLLTWCEFCELDFDEDINLTLWWFSLRAWKMGSWRNIPEKLGKKQHRQRKETKWKEEKSGKEKTSRGKVKCKFLLASFKFGFRFGHPEKIYIERHKLKFIESDKIKLKLHFWKNRKRKKPTQPKRSWQSRTQ